MGKHAGYKDLILREFYFAGSLSCADLSERISKSLPLTMKVLNELITDGYVRESGYAPSSGGRRPLMYSLIPGTVYILAVAMDQLVTRISIMDSNNRHVAGIQRIDLPLQGNPDALKLLGEAMEAAIVSSGVDRRLIIGAGIGMPGFIDVKKGLNYSFVESRGESITTSLSRKLNMPVFIDNDSSLIALAEFRFGAARNVRNAMVLNINWGIGLGMVLNGELFRGHNGFAGEFSHLPMFTNNKLCACGKTGCLETESSLNVVVDKAAAGIAAGRLSSLGRSFPSGDVEKDCEALIQAAMKGDQFAVELLSEAGYHIGRGVAILIHLVNPEVVILSGRGAFAGKIWQVPIQQALNEDCIPRLAANTGIEISTLGYEAELIGSAALVMENRLKISGNARDLPALVQNKELK